MLNQRQNKSCSKIGSSCPLFPSLVLVIVFSVVLAACGNNQNTASEQTESGETSAMANEEDEATTQPATDTPNETTTPQAEAATDTLDETTTPQPEADEEETTTEEEQSWIEVSAVIDNPAEFVGQTVTIRGSIAEIIEEGFSFTLSDSPLLGFDALLVIGADQEIAADVEGLFPSEGSDAIIEVTGTLYDFEEWTNTPAEEQLEADLYVDHSARPVLIADSINTASAQEEVASSETEMTDAASTDSAQITPLSEVVNNPEEFVGQTMTTRGDFDTIIEPGYSFTLNDPALLGLDSLLIVGADRTIVPADEAFFTPGEEANANMEVTGTVYIFADGAGFEDENLVDVDNDLYIEYVGRPVLVVDSITIILDE